MSARNQPNQRTCSIMKNSQELQARPHRLAGFESTFVYRPAVAVGFAKTKNQLLVERVQGVNLG